MKIKRLELRNFRNHVHSKLDFSDASFVLIKGGNGQGKTSLGQAISLNLAGTTMGLSSDGKGFAEKVAQGEKQSVITTEIQGQHILEKTVTLSMTSRNEVVKCLDAPDETKAIKGLENFLTRYSDALKIALNTDYFVRMNEKDQKNLLAKLVLPSRYDFPQDKVTSVNGLLDSPIDFSGEPFAVIETAYKKLYKEREAVNRDVKNFVIPDALPIPKGVDSESLQKELTGIREQRVKLQAERDEAVAKANKVEVERATLQTKIENLRAKVDEGKKTIHALDSDILPDEELDKLESIADRAEELEKLKSQHSGFLGAMRTVDEQIKRLRDVQDQGATCPTCDQDIDSDKIANLIAELKKEIAQTDAELQKLDTQIESIGDCAAAKQKLDKHESAVKEQEELTKSLTDTVAEGKKTRAAIEALGTKEDATLPFSDPLGALQAKEDKVLEQLRPVITAEERAKDIKEKTAQFGKLEAKAKKLDELTKYFDKDGIKAKLIGEHIGSFENKINTVLDRFGFKAILGSDMEFKVCTKRGYTGPIAELSKAERQLFYPSFQCAVSIASGIKMAVIDDMDTYLKEDGLRNDMYSSIYSLVKDNLLEQVILIEASTDQSVPNPRADNSAYFFVEDGVVSRLV